MAVIQTITRTKIAVAVAAAVATLAVVVASHVAAASHAVVHVVIKTFAITTNMTTTVACITIAACITCIISIMTVPAPAPVRNRRAAHNLATAVVRDVVVDAWSLHAVAVLYPVASKHHVVVGY